VIKLTEEDFKMIYETHFDNLRRYLYYRSGDQDLSKDIAQNVFMKIWKKKIDTTKGNIKSLLFKMGTDEFISYYRRSKIEREYVNSQDFKLVHQDDDDDDFSEKKKMYEKALKALTDKQRVALLMNKMEGLTYKEIAESLNLSQKAIEKRISQGLSVLKNNLNSL
jgi:RNA polymerase sigma-70 factor (ECF subfamily)